MCKIRMEHFLKAASTRPCVPAPPLVRTRTIHVMSVAWTVNEICTCSCGTLGDVSPPIGSSLRPGPTWRFIGCACCRGPTPKLMLWPRVGLRGNWLATFVLRTADGSVAETPAVVEIENGGEGLASFFVASLLLPVLCEATRVEYVCKDIKMQ